MILEESVGVAEKSRELPDSEDLGLEGFEDPLFDAAIGTRS